MSELRGKFLIAQRSQIPGKFGYGDPLLWLPRLSDPRPGTSFNGVSASVQTRGESSLEGVYLFVVCGLGLTGLLLHLYTS